MLEMKKYRTYVKNAVRLILGRRTTFAGNKVIATSRSSG
jgi:hypothetical protein